MTGRDGKDNGGWRDGTVNESISTGRDGYFQREWFSWRDGTVKFNGAEIDDGTGRRDQFDDGFTVPSRPAVTAVTVPPKYRDKPCK